MTGISLRGVVGWLCVAAGLWAADARSQSTDGYHTLQIIPVAVDTSSFTQRFHFRKQLAASTIITPTYFPATGTSQSGPLACPSFEIPQLERTFTSLRELCPGLPGGSQFGYLSLAENGPGNRPFSAFTRVSNAAGAGFAVEAFPPHTFVESFASASGIRRLAAGNGAPAYQTNCFIARLNEVDSVGAPGPLTVFYGVGDSQGNQVGTVNFIDLERGQFVRILDVFNAVGAPLQDYNDASFRYGPPSVPSQEVAGALMGFCTVQDNTSFGADFRIAKTEFGICGAESCGDWMNPMDEHVNRETVVGKDIALTGDGSGRAFSIPVGVAQNSHVYYFRRPDYIQCELLHPQTRQRLDISYGLEMRLANVAGAVLAGGNDVTGFGRLYLGDKRGSSNTRYVLQVERNESVQAPTAERPYLIHCQSGSGHTPGDTVRFNAPVDQF